MLSLFLCMMPCVSVCKCIPEIVLYKVEDQNSSFKSGWNLGVEKGLHTHTHTHSSQAILVNECEISEIVIVK